MPARTAARVDDTAATRHPIGERIEHLAIERLAVELVPEQLEVAVGAGVPCAHHVGGAARFGRQWSGHPSNVPGEARRRAARHSNSGERNRRSYRRMHWVSVANR